MNIEITYKGEKQVIKNVDIGGWMKIEYVKSDGVKMEYRLMITKKETLLVNK